jgi:hypothetical protein
MRVELGDYGTTIILSRRNLESLLAKLDGNPPDSVCEIGAPDIYGSFSVKAEENGPHYAHESRGDVKGIAGQMHPDTEGIIGHEDVEVEKW